MSWLELDDGILRHPKFIRAIRLAGSEAIHLWLGLRAYCGQLLTDGEIPDDMVDAVDGPSGKRARNSALEALISVGLIEKTDVGLRMHDYLDWSRSREEIEAKRQSNAKRQRNHRESVPSVTRDNPVTNALVTASVTTPSPLPSDPLLTIPDKKDPLASLGVPKYPAEFEILWEQTGRRGLKAKALKAWKAHGRPSWIEAQSAWRAYLLSDRPVAGFVFDLSTWLNGDGHTQTWQPARGRPASQPQRSDPNCRDWHAGGKNTGRRNPRGQQPACPECKSVYLRSWTDEDRPSEPTPIGEIT